ncbi:unnamed protein product [Ranitomeya imitator]|uniref:Helix-turn-helix domain-containing protein n=1 Tax=Ranitomeya imitator TaxID=111125 RepID=A0ABN9LNB0_9NEOB|nr:unnamed protein product [Ranitomeya imitator]
MAVFENKFVYQSILWRHVRAWWHYIDDIFMIWDGSLTALDDFHKSLNGVYPELQFTLVHSTVQIQFLDTLVYKDGDRLKTDIFVKETDRNSLLLYDSNHPRKMIDSLPWSQLLRVRRIVSDENTVSKRLDEMCTKFVMRGYPEKNVSDLKKRALSTSRENARSNIVAL